MTEITKNGKRYFELTEEEAKIYTDTFIIDGKKSIAPPDCKHNFVIERGIPRNIKGCTKCIYWEFTNEEPTRADA